MPKYRVEVDTGWWLDFYTIKAKDEKEAREKAERRTEKTALLPPYGRTSKYRTRKITTEGSQGG